MTLEEANLLFLYEPSTGRLLNRSSRGRAKVGDEAGWVMVSGGKSYRSVSVGKRKYLTHRVIWLILTGQFPSGDIDHEDGNGLNNLATNLKAVPHSKNQMNQRKPSNNKSGHIGVHWCRTTETWVSQLRLGGKTVFWKKFDTLAEAISARKAAEVSHGFHPNHGSVRPL